MTVVVLSVTSSAEVGDPENISGLRTASRSPVAAALIFTFIAFRYEAVTAFQIAPVVVE
jgi:hypothetical protein